MNMPPQPKIFGLRQTKTFDFRFDILYQRRIVKKRDPGLLSYIAILGPSSHGNTLNRCIIAGRACFSLGRCTEDVRPLNA
jgi:hypothetical protein